MCKAATAAYALKEIWNSRCRALFQGERMNARRIAMRVLNQIQLTALPEKMELQYARSCAGHHGDSYMPTKTWILQVELRWIS